MSPQKETFEQHGFVIIEDVLDKSTVHNLMSALQKAQGEISQRSGAVFAMRNLFKAVPEINDLVSTPEIRNVAESLLGRGCFAVRGLFFDKTPEANWKVPFHQDLTIAVKKRHDVDGYGPWTAKANIDHVQPPSYILEHMVALRVHLDDCETDNGVLRVIPGSHRTGRLSNDQIDDWKKKTPVATCAVRQGGVMAMRPLLLHASSPAASPCHRRVIHIEFANIRLDAPLNWHCSV